MKIVLILALVIGIVGYFVFTSGDFANFDPNQQGRDARAAISDGMSWDEVNSEAGDPQEYRPLQKRSRGTGANKFDTVKAGPEIPFTPNGLADRLSQGSLPHGFVFDYRFSQSVAFRVSFDSEGLVTGVEDLVTMADLLQTRE